MHLIYQMKVTLSRLVKRGCWALETPSLPLQVTGVPALLAEEQSQQMPAGTPISLPCPDLLTSTKLPEKLLFFTVAMQGQLQGGQFRWTVVICPQECHQGYHISR